MIVPIASNTVAYIWDAIDGAVYPPPLPLGLSLIGKQTNVESWFNPFISRVSIGQKFFKNVIFLISFAEPSQERRISGNIRGRGSFPMTWKGPQNIKTKIHFKKKHRFLRVGTQKNRLSSVGVCSSYYIGKNLPFPSSIQIWILFNYYD